MDKLHKIENINLHTYKYILLDLWGVIIDGEGLFPKAMTFLEYLKEHQKEVVFLSNTPETVDSLRPKLDRWGITQEYYRDIVTSGVAVQRYFAKSPYRLGKEYCNVGDREHQKLLSNFALTKKSMNENFDFVLVTSFNNELASTENLQTLKNNDVPFLCVNPDLFIITLKGEKKFCAGELARRYEEIGGEVIYIGKPHPLIFEIGLEAFSTQDKSKTLMIGDSINTDIQGAYDFGIHSLLVNQTEYSPKSTYYISQFTF